MKTIKIIGLVSGLFLLAHAKAQAQSFLNYTGGIYTQNFDSLPYSNGVPVKAANPVTLASVKYYFNGAASIDLAAAIDSTGPTNSSTGGLGLSATMPGWYAVDSLSNLYGAQTNGITTGGFYSFGNVTSTNRALGFVTTSSSGVVTYGLRIVNNTGSGINNINMNFTGELWLQETITKTNDFGYMVGDPGYLPTNNLSAIGAYGFASAASNGMDGTLVVNQTNVNVSVALSTTWTNGGVLWLTWQSDSSAGKAQQIAMDNFTFYSCAAPSPFNVALTPSTVVCSGTSVQFTASPTGGVTPYAYQWTKNGSNIGNATNSTYTGVAGTDFVNLDQITVVASSACGVSYTPPVVVMTVNQIPNAPTASAATGIGTTLFNANWSAATGATGYQLDVATDSGFGSFVSGYNSLNVGNVTTYSVTGLSAGTTYYYQIRAYDTCGTSSDSATTTVTTASGCVAATAATPVASPGTTGCVGTVLTLTETPGGGTAPFDYLWKKGGAALSNGGTISGVTSNVLTITGMAVGDTGNYTCDATAQCGGSTSTSPGLTVTVNALPTITLGASPIVCGGTTSALLPYSATTGSPNQYSIAWDPTAQAAGFVNVGATSLPGSSPITLTVPGGAAAGTYNGTLTVDNSSTNCASSGTAFIVLINANPVITNQPSTTVVAQGSNATFTVAATASSPSYQWQVNKGSGYVNVTGGDGSTSSGGTAFTTVVTTNTMSGYLYQVIVTDGSSGCSTFSSAAKLTVVAPFGAGNLAVYSADIAATNNTSFSIIEINTNTPNQAAIQTISVNGTSGNAALRGSGSAGTAGLLANSADGAYVAFTGENSTNSTGSINTTIVRSVGTFDYTGKFTLQTKYSGASGNPVRCATSVDDVNWYASDGGGVYTNNAIAPSTTASIHGIKSFGGTVYVLQASSSAVVVSTLSADGTTLTPLNGLTNDSFAVDFYLVSSGSNGTAYDILYVLENQNSPTDGNVVKYSLVGGVWTEWLNGGNYGFYSESFGGDGLCATAIGGGGAALYITTGAGTNSANSVMQLIDTSGWNADLTIGSSVTLFTGAAGTTMKGIAFAPIQAVPCIPAIIGSPNSQIVGGGSTVNFYMNATGSSLTYQWQKNGANISDGGTISGSLTTNLTLTGIAVADSASTWDCQAISGGGCTNTTATATLIVNQTAPIQAFGPSNIVLEVMGDGLTPLSGAATPIHVLELTTNGALVQTIIMQNSSTAPANAPFNCTDSGSAGSDGNLTRSADGRFIILPGYNAAAGETSVASSNDLRALGVLQYDGTTNTPYGLSFGQGSNIRGATSADGTNFWIAGQNTTNSGLTYFNGSLGTSNLLSVNNCRTVKIFSNQLYAVSGSGNPGHGIFAVGTGLPASGTPVWSLVISNGTPSASPYNFEFNPATNVCYLTDDGATTNFNGSLNGGGIQKYTNSTTTGWALAYIITNGCTKGTGAYGLAVDWSGPNPILYATTASSSSNRVIRIVDNSGSLSAATTIYAPASANYYLRGLAFAPVQPAAPACTAPTITGDPSPVTVYVSSNANFTVSATGAALTYQWQKNGANVSDGGSISGSATPSLLLTGVSIVDSNTSWQCAVISSGTCSNLSTPALLFVDYLPYQAWQIQYFGSTNAANAAMNVDADGTGQDNLYKFVAGLDPTNPASVFVLQIASVGGQPTQKQLLFNPVVAGRTYTPWFTTDLVNGVWSPLTTFTGPLTNGSQVTLTDTNAAQSATFYRVNISLP